MLRRLVRFVRLAVCAAPLLAGGCGARPAVKPAPGLDLSVEAAADMNPDPVGRPAPVAVHLFQLADTARFAAANGLALVTRERVTLGADSLGGEEFVLNPGEQREIAWPLRPGARALGVVVLFRDFEHAQGTVQAPIGPGARLRLRVLRGTAALEPVAQ